MTPAIENRRDTGVRPDGSPRRLNVASDRPNVGTRKYRLVRRGARTAERGATKCATDVGDGAAEGCADMNAENSAMALLVSYPR